MGCTTHIERILVESRITPWLKTISVEPPMFWKTCWLNQVESCSFDIIRVKMGSVVPQFLCDRAHLVGSLLNWATKKTPYYFPVYWLVNKDPYSGLLWSLYNWVVFHPLYTPNNQGFFIAQLDSPHLSPNFTCTLGSIASRALRAAEISWRSAGKLGNEEGKPGLAEVVLRKVFFSVG